MSSILEKCPRINDELIKYTKPTIQRPLQYGTAGFRENAELLHSTLHRMGMLAVLRSKHRGKIVGVMVTASHNPALDNGIKMIDTDGGMLAPQWEEHATQLANADTEKVVDVLDAIISSEKIDLERTGNIFIARDTRDSSESLAELAREGALLVGGNVLDFALQTTPQLHHLIRMWNFEAYNKGDWASETGYYNMMADGFKQLVSMVDPKVLENRKGLYVDAAHGVGALQFSKLAKELERMLPVSIRNVPSDGELNHECGAEHVQKKREHPSGFSRDADRNKRCCSFDGDADRIVYHYFDDDGGFHLLDGDKIAALFATFFRENLLLVKDAELSFGVVQTAYANGASTDYLKNLGINVVVAKTGVKFCHEKATEFDIGMYFEANGHGTVLFKDAAVEKLQKLEASTTEEAKKQALQKLLASYQLINQSVGDAMSDCLFIEAILILREMSIKTWDNVYQDRPSRQTKLAVEDRALIQCNDNETICLSPAGLQEEIDNVVNSVGQARAFVRPSGTEDMVRVYAEAETQEIADNLALAIAKVVHRLANGVGDEPNSLLA